jgi:predicted Rossmann fold flavoprotein
MTKKIIIIGGGASGMFCAANLAKLIPKAKIIVLEKSSKLLAKVKISGGGRCNVTHNCFEIAPLSQKYPRGKNFVKKLFHQFSTTDTLEWFTQRGVAIKAEADGRMFPTTDDSQTIINCLTAECEAHGVQIMQFADVVEIVKAKDTFVVNLRDKRSFEANHVVVACGGFPKAEQFDWLTKLGHSIAQPVPSLFTFNLAQKNITQLMGVAVSEVKVKIIETKHEFTGPLLITHWGFSGPAVLKLSAFAAVQLAKLNYNFTVQINWLPQYNENSAQTQLQILKQLEPSKKVINSKKIELPSRLWEYLCELSGINAETTWQNTANKQLNALAKNLCTFTESVKGKTTYKEEFVTSGGINTTEIDVQTMESKIVPNIYFTGEIVNVDGITGGFNFQFAWSSAWAAANAIAKK